MMPPERLTPPDEAEGFVAVIGMAGRFPGAAGIEQLWANLRAGVESLTPLPEPAGGGPGYVAAYGMLDGADEFDADFFGHPPAEALILDPQQRVFLECAHQALERAGYGDPDRRDSVGVFAGGSTTDYRAAVTAQLDQLPFVDSWQVRVGTAPDFLATRVAHKLRLTGPAVTVQTACSTSLVAVHLASQALLAGDCRLALAGGAAVHVPYPQIAYTEGGIISPDGHCRAFDAAATGTVGGSAAAVVVLKPLPDALADRDHIHAVVRGSATNNDGGSAVGFTAPSVDGQARVIRAAQVVAGVDADSIGYLEAHGTGTRLGDPIEVAALTSAFRETTDRRGYCAIGSVKSNLGHTDAAAGVVGLIKAVLAVEHGEIPPTLHVSEPNPQIDWAGSPFLVAATGHRWPAAGGPRRAGVSALGVGGTNAHVVLEQAPPPPPPDPAPAGAPQLLVSSATMPSARAAAASQLAAYLDDHPDAELADVAWTLQVGRQPHPLRQYAVGSSPVAAAAAMRALGAGEPEVGAELAELAGLGEASGEPPPPVVFLFPGQGGQHVGMAAQLHRHEPAFQARLAEIAAVAAPGLGLDLREVLYPPAGDPVAEQWARERLATIAVGQPAVFAVEYALAGLLREWGIRPAAVLGHSLGAFAAACLAGVLPLADAVRLVVRRGELLQSLPAGAMVGVGLPVPELTPLLPPELAVAAVNGPRRCAVAGPAEPVRAFADQLQRRGVEARLLPIATAGHSRLVEPVVAEFRAAAAGLDLRPAELPFLSDSTGDWAEPAEPAIAGYWATHLRAPVQFDRALSTLAADDRRVLLEVGPGRTLATLARQHPALARHRVVATLPHPLDDTDDRSTLLGAVGQLWSVGVAVDWPRLHGGRRRHRVVLPTYPFQRQRFLVPPVEPAAARPAADTGAEAGRLVLGEPPAGAAMAAEPAVDTPAPPEPAVPEALRVAFGQALGITSVTVHDDLFQLGGDSLTATKLAAWAQQRFGVPVTAADVIRARTAARCARLVEERSSGMFEDDDDRQYQVVRNHEQQYSVWPTSHPLPAGWQPAGPTGTKAECLAAINERWTDLRPASIQSRWLSRRRPVGDPACRVYCFPHSGGAAGEYLRWADELPQLELWGVNLPGRGPRLDEPQPATMAGLAADLVAGVGVTDPRPADRAPGEPPPGPAIPYVLFGHSFGGLLAYHVAQRLRERGAPPPRLLVLSGYPPPHLPRQVPVLSTLPDEEFLRRLDQAYGGVPAELLADRELAELVLPAYRADLAILESYQDPQLPPLDCPLLVVGGDRDRYGAEVLEQWAQHTTGACQVRMLPGGHFYFREQPEPLLALLREQLGALAATP